MWEQLYLTWLYQWKAPKLWYGVHNLWGFSNRTGLLVDLKREMTCLNLSRWLRPYIRISISARTSEGSGSNNDACEGLSCFLGCCRISVQRYMLRVDEKISWGEVSVSLVCPHLVSLVELCGQIVMFSEMWGVFMNVVTNNLCVLMIEVCKNSSESHMVVFQGGFWCTNACGFIVVCIIVWECRWNWVAWGRIFVWCDVIYRKTRVVFDHPVIHFHTNKRYEERAVFYIWLARVFVLILCAFDICAGLVDHIILFLQKKSHCSYWGS